MLIAGLYFSGKPRKGVFLVGALASHIVSVVSLLLIPLNKRNVRLVTVSLFVLLLALFLLADRLEGRLKFYQDMRYFFDIGEFKSLTDVYSFLNVTVLLFFLYGSVIGGFTKREGVVLSVLYVVSIYFPLFYRLYLFSFFCVACSRDMLIDKGRVSH